MKTNKWYLTTEENLRRLYRHPESDYKMLCQFVKDNGFDRMMPSHYGNCTTVIKYGRISSQSDIGKNNLAPYQDHCVFFKSTERGITCLTYSPYQDAKNIRRTVENWAKKNGLKADLYDADRCWYSDHTCFVIIHLLTTEIKVP